MVASTHRTDDALAFLEAHEESRLHVTFTVAGELAAGLSLAARLRWEDLLGPFHALPFTADVSWEYGRAFRYLSGGFACPDQ